MRTVVTAVRRKSSALWAAVLVTVVSLAALVPFVLSQNAYAAGTVEISTVAELRQAVESQADGQVWMINAGTYGLSPFDSYSADGRTGWYFPVTANNLTIKGVGNPTIYGTGYTPNANLQTQNLVTVFGDNVTIDGLTLMPKVQPNKTIEVKGANFTLKNSTITPNTLSMADYDSIADPQDRVEYQQWGGSLYFSHEGAHVVENVTIHNSGVSFRYAPSGTNITFTNVDLINDSDYDWINTYRFSSGFNNAGNTTTGAPTVVYQPTEANLGSIVGALQDGDVLNLESSLSLTEQLTITKAITLNGNGHTLTGNFVKTSNSNNSVVGVQSDNVTINDLTVDAVNGDGNKLHGINVFGSNDVTLNNITALNGRSGVGVNSSTVTIDGITTSGNVWHGVNIDKPGAHLYIKGANSHGEAKPLFVDDRTVGQVTDVDNRYDIVPDGAGDIYVADVTAPTISWQLQPAPLLTTTFKIRPITSEEGMTKSVYIDEVTPSMLCRTLTSVHKNFDVSNGACQALFDGLSDGTHKFIAVFSDQSGNTTVSDSATFVVDRTGPTITPKPGTIGTPENDIYSNVSFKLFDAAKVDKYSINGHMVNVTDSKWTDANFQNLKAHLSEGLNTLVAYDVLGNMSTLEFTIDYTAPAAPTLQSPGNGVVQNGGPTQVWSHPNPSDVAYYIYESYSDAGMTAPIYSTTTTNTQRTIGGTQNLTLWWRIGAVDAAGNVAWSDLWELTVDNTAPDLSAVTYTVAGNEITPDLTTTETGLTYVWTQVSGPSSADISDSTALAPVFTVIEDGVYEFQIVATDEAGNATTRTFSFTYVTPEPTTTTSEGTDTGGASTTTPLVDTPPIVGPGFTAVGVLGATDEATTDAANSDGAVEGASTVDTLAQAVDADNTDGTAMGLAWYWWVLIIGAAAVLIWGIVAAFQRRGNA